MAEPVGVQVVEAGPDVLGAAELAAVRGEHQPGPLGDPERRRELGRAAPALVVGEAEADHPAAGVLRREPGQGAGVERVPGPVGGDDHRDPEAGALARVACGIQHQVGERGDAVEAGGVPAGVDLDLQPPAAVAYVVLGGLEHQPAYVVLRAQHRPRHVVQALEPEPALLVGRATARAASPRPGSRAGGSRRGRPARAAWRAASIPVKCRCRCALGSASRSRTQPTNRGAASISGTMSAS